MLLEKLTVAHVVKNFFLLVTLNYKTFPDTSELSKSSPHPTLFTKVRLTIIPQSTYFFSSGFWTIIVSVFHIFFYSCSILNPSHLLYLIILTMSAADHSDRAL
jgi:hypothetical protein